jgi:hypothetical protein
MNKLYAYPAALIVDSLGKAPHVSAKIICMDSHLPGHLFAIRSDKRIAGYNQADITCC